jgi:hypothetical protein
MKKMFKLLMCAAIVAAGFTACSEEVTPITDPTNPTVGPGEEEGQPTNATFSFKLSGTSANTKSLYPDATEVNPPTVSEFRVLIFKGNDIEVDTARAITTGDSLLTISLTAGQKRIYVYTNGGYTPAGTNPYTPPTWPGYVGIPGKGAATTLANMNGIFRLAAAYLPAPVRADILSDLPEMHKLYPNPNSAAGGPTVSKFFFSNSVSNTLVTLVPGVSAADSKDPAGGAANNYIDIELERPVAKVSITKAIESKPDTGPLTQNTIITRDSSGIITEVKYQIWSANVSMYPFQITTGTGGAELVTPGYVPLNDNDTMNLKAQYARELGKYVDNTNQNVYIDIPNRGANAPAIGSGYYYYIPENSPSEIMRGNTTIAAVQATFRPTKFHYVAYNSTYTTHLGVNYNESGGGFTPYPATDDLPSGQTNLNMYLFTKDDVLGLPENTLFAGTDALKLVKKVTYHVLNPGIAPKGIDDGSYVDITPAQIAQCFVTYYGGKAYYRLDLGKQNTTTGKVDYVVRRNYYYDANITGFAKLGDNLPSKLIEPITEILVDKPTNLSVHIILKNWAGEEIITDI